jgi:hypothetical protein
MGAGNVKAVYGWWGHLPDRPFRLLAFMALTAKDDATPPTYWGGRESMAVGIGRDVPTGDDDAAAKERHATFEAVRWTVNKLIKAGAVERTRAASPGRTAEYALILRPAMTQTQSVPNDPDSVCATTQTQSAQRPRLSLRMGQTESGPEEYKDYRGLTSGANTHLPAQASVGAREGSRPEMKDTSGASVLAHEKPHRYMEASDPPGECVRCANGPTHPVHHRRTA